METLKIVCTAILLISLSAGAQEFRKSGTSGFVFLELPVTARYAALGEAGVTLRDAGSEGLFVNPALIAFSDSRLALNVSYAKWYVETSHQAAGLTYQLAQFGTIGVQAVYFDFGEVPRTQNFLPGIFEPVRGMCCPTPLRALTAPGPMPSAFPSPAG